MTGDFSRPFDKRFEPARDGGFLSIEDMERFERWQRYQFVKLIRTIFANLIRWMKRQQSWLLSFLTLVATITAVYLAIVWVIMDISADELRLFDNMTITSWEDRRSLGLSFAGILAPWLAIIGFLLSARRTQTMIAANELKQKEDLQTTSFKASEMVETGDLPSISGIETLVELARLDSSHQNLEASITTILYRLLDLAQKPKNENVERDAPKQAVIERLLIALCRLQHIKFGNPPHGLIERLELEALDLRGVRLNYGIIDIDKTEPVIGFNFTDCWLHNSSFRQTSFSNVSFGKSNLTGVDFTRANFLQSNPAVFTCNLRGAQMNDADIDRTDFSGISELDENQLNECRYDRLSPPRNLPVRITQGGVTGQVQNKSQRAGPYVTLPTPFKRDMDDPESKSNCYYTREETLSFYGENKAARPKNRNDDPVHIFCPDDPDNPILD